MITLDALREIWTVITRNRVRALLTAAGVFWGMFMLVVLLGLGEGMKDGITRNMRRAATNSVTLWGDTTSLTYGGFQPGRRVRFRLKDGDALRQQLTDVRVVAPRLRYGGWRNSSVVSHGSESGTYGIYGDIPDYQQVQIFLFEKGRFINPLDIEQKRKVAVIGKQVYDDLFKPGEEALGASISLGGVWFQVVGVFDTARADNQGDREAQAIHIPLSTLQAMGNYGDTIGWMTLALGPGEDAASVSDEAKTLLRERHGVHPEDVRAIGGWNSAEEFQRVQRLFGAIRVFVWIVGAATLLSGIVGVSNIMLIVVRERTPEIGLRRAIGATARSIVAMIVQEAVFLTLVSGFLGLFGGLAFTRGLGWYIGPDNASIGAPSIDVQSLLIAALVLCLSSLLSGLLPAVRAAAIEPIEALRTE